MPVVSGQLSFREWVGCDNGSATLKRIYTNGEAPGNVNYGGDKLPGYLMAFAVWHNVLLAD
jgi:hypothetical protein